MCSSSFSSLTYFWYFILCCLDEWKPSHRGTKSTWLHGAVFCTVTWQLTLWNQRDTNGRRRNMVTELEVEKSWSDGMEWWLIHGGTWASTSMWIPAPRSLLLWLTFSLISHQCSFQSLLVITHKTYMHRERRHTSKRITVTVPAKVSTHFYFDFLHVIIMYCVRIWNWTSLELLSHQSFCFFFDMYSQFFYPDISISTLTSIQNVNLSNKQQAIVTAENINKIQIIAYLHDWRQPKVWPEVKGWHFNQYRCDSV